MVLIDNFSSPQLKTLATYLLKKLQNFRGKI